MIQSIGLAWAFRVLGIIVFFVNTICAVLMRDRNKTIGASQVSFDYRLFKRYEFCLLEAWGFFSILGYVVLLFSLPNYASSVGLTPYQGSIIGALLNLGQAIGRPLIGIFSDRAGRINIASFLTALCGVFCFVIWIFAKSFGVLIFFALIAGTIAGTIWTTIAPVGAEVVGLRELPSALSITWIVLVLPSLCKWAGALQQGWLLILSSLRSDRPGNRLDLWDLSICTNLYRFDVFHCGRFRVATQGLEDRPIGDAGC